MALVPDLATYLAFCAAAVALILTPGPDTMYVFARGIQGRNAGVRSAFGVATGVLLHTTAAALGLAALFRTVPAARRAVTYAGAAYLVYLGVQAVRNDEFGDVGTGAATPDDAGIDVTAGSFRRGVLVNALNPKVALFFLAFLPTFAGTGSGSAVRMAVLGLVYALLSAVYLSAVAAAADRAGRLLADARVRRGLDVAAAAAFVVFAVVLLL